MNFKFAIICLIYFVYLSLIEEYIAISALGVSFSLYIFLSFIDKLGREVPLKEFIILLASFQWIVGAKIAYNLGKQHHKYFMYVDEERYMTYVVPSVLLFYLGLIIIPTKFKLNKLSDIFIAKNKVVKNGALTLVLLGLLAVAISRFYQGGLSFLLYLTELLLYVGLGYLMFIYKKYKYILFVGTLSIVFVFSLNAGMFHKLLLIGSFFSFFIIPPKINFISKLTLILFGISFMYVIQAVKKEYRDIIWKSKTGKNPIVIFWGLVKEEFVVNQSDYVYLTSDNETLKDEAEINIRLNQGWIISKTLENVPKNIPFQKGRTIMESIEASILPRFLFPNKVGAEHGLVNFQKITGLSLHRSASMELSLVAEFYANYGYIGGLFAIFIYGLFLAIIIRFIVGQLGEGSALIYLWFILFFFQVVKAEIDLIKILNHIVKSILFFIVIKYIFTQILGYKLFLNKEN